MTDATVWCNCTSVQLMSFTCQPYDVWSLFNELSALLLTPHCCWNSDFSCLLANNMKAEFFCRGLSDATDSITVLVFLDYSLWCKLSLLIHFLFFAHFPIRYFSLAFFTTNDYAEDLSYWFSANRNLCFLSTLHQALAVLGRFSIQLD